MNQINPYIQKFADATSKLGQLGLHKTKQWFGFTVDMISLIPSQMQTHPHFAIGIITTTNLLFFAVVSPLIAYMDKRLENQEKPLDDDQRFMKNILLNGVVLGGTAFAVNSYLSKMTQYRFSPQALASISMIMILCHMIFAKLNNFFKNAAHVEKKMVLETNKPMLPNQLEHTKKNPETEEFLNNPTDLETQKKEPVEQASIEKPSDELETPKKNQEVEIPEKATNTENPAPEIETLEQNTLVKTEEAETETLEEAETLPVETQEPKVNDSQPLTNLLPPSESNMNGVPLTLNVKKIVKKKPKLKKPLNVENFIKKYAPKNKGRVILNKNKGIKRFGKSAFKQNLPFNHAQSKHANLLFKSSPLKARPMIRPFQPKNMDFMATFFGPKAETSATKSFQPKIANPIFASAWSKAGTKGSLTQTKNMHSIFTPFWPKFETKAAKPAPISPKAMTAPVKLPQKETVWDNFEYFAFI